MAMTRDKDRRPHLLTALAPVFLFISGLALYLWCTFTHWCMAGHLDHAQRMGAETDIAWGCVFTACGVLAWISRYDKVRLLWLLLSILSLAQFMWFSLLTRLVIIVAIFALFTMELRARSHRQLRGHFCGDKLANAALAVILLLNLVSLGSIFLVANHVGRRVSQPDARQLMIKNRIEKVGGIAVYQQNPWRPFCLYGASFSNVSLRDDDLAFMQSFPEISQLDLSGTLITDAGMTNLLHLRSLNRISLSRTRVTDAGTKFLQHMSGYHIVIDLSDTAIGDKTVENLPASDVIFNLDLRRTKITDKALATLATRTNEIWDMFLDGTRISDEGLQQFKTARVTRSLDLRNTLITDVGLDALIYMGKHNSLDFELGGSGITEQGAKRLYDECYGGKVNTGYWIKTFKKE